MDNLVPVHQAPIHNFMFYIYTISVKLSINLFKKYANNADYNPIIKLSWVAKISLHIMYVYRHIFGLSLKAKLTRFSVSAILIANW